LGGKRRMVGERERPQKTTPVLAISINNVKKKERVARVRTVLRNQTNKSVFTE